MNDDIDPDVLKSILARDDLRKEARLPRLNIPAEIEKVRKNADSTAARDHYAAQRYTHAKKRESIREEIIEKARASGNTTFPKGYFGNYLLKTLVNKKFKDFLSS